MWLLLQSISKSSTCSRIFDFRTKMYKIQYCRKIFLKPIQFQQYKTINITRNLSTKKSGHHTLSQQRTRLTKTIAELFVKRPLLVNSFIYGTLYMAAEFSQQTISRKILTNGKPTAYDPHMITRFGVLGGVVYPQIYYFWYRWLDKNFVGTTRIIVLKKLLLDQFLFTPPLLAAFFVGMSILEGKEDLLDELKIKFTTTFGTSCVFWIPVQTINFLMIPPQYRIVYVASSAFVWINILCYIKNLETEVEEDEEEFPMMFPDSR